MPCCTTGGLMTALPREQLSGDSERKSTPGAELGRFTMRGLNFVPGQPVYLYGANCASVLQGLGDLQSGQGCPGGRAINPLAFTVATSGLGDAPRNFARGFGAWQMDLAVRRDFPIHESLKLQFRAEAFNIFNHPNFGTINPNFGPDLPLGRPRPRSRIRWAS